MKTIPKRAPRKISARIERKDLPVALVTGFEPFGGDARNPSREIALALDGEIIAAHRIVGASLPTEFATALPALRALLRKHRPTLVIALGLAGNSTQIALERVAINLIDARISDNAGAQPVDIPVVRGAPAAYFTTLPVKAMLARLRHARVPASLSQSAGTFVCNQVFFGLAHILARRPDIRGGFIHVPSARETLTGRSKAAGMPLATMRKAIRLCLDAALNTVEDLRYAAGETQ